MATPSTRTEWKRKLDPVENHPGANMDYDFFGLKMDSYRNFSRRREQQKVLQGWASHPVPQ